MPDNASTNYFDAVTDPMPKGSVKDGAVAVKAFIGIFGIADMVLFGLSFWKSRNKQVSGDMDPVQGKWTNENYISLFDGLDLLSTLIDFSLSCIVGYTLYAPMDMTIKEATESDYGKLIESTSEACGKYTNIWLVKTVLALFIPTISWASSTFDKLKLPDEKEKVFNKLEILNTVCGGILSTISAFFEILACAEAGKVDNNLLTDHQKKDKQCFICETVGFICDDIRAIVDCLIDLFEAKNIPILVVREILAAGYAVPMFVEAGLINS